MMSFIPMMLLRMLRTNTALTTENRPILYRSDFRKEDGHIPSSFFCMVKIPSFSANFGFDISQLFWYDIITKERKESALR